MAKHDRRFKYQSAEDKPVTISLRLPQELHARLVRYADEHRQSLSELVKDGIEWRLSEDADPRSRSAASTIEATEYQIDGASILRDMQATLARHDTQMQAIMQAIERQTTPAGNGLHEDMSYGVLHSKTAIEPEEQAAQNTALANVEGASFDTTKYRLGKLCPQGHEYQGTGQSLRVNNKAGYCKACNVEQQREGRARRGQQKSQAQAVTN